MAVAIALPGGVLRLLDEVGLADVDLPPGLAVVVFSTAIVGAAFLLSWAAEVAQKDIAQGLALALVALVAVLPEYAVDFYLTWQAGQDPSGEYVQFATANMTGANRLLIGLGWPLVVLVTWMRRRQGLNLERGLSLELLVLVVATLYAFTIPFKGSIALWDGFLLIGLFAFYMWMSSRGETEEPELIGPSAAIGALPTRARRATVISLFLFAAVVILASAEPFTEGLLDSGDALGVNEFLLIQWVAPLASESPEILVATLFALKGHGAAAMTMLISSKVNQWTLLVGSLPLVYTVSLGEVTAEGLPLDGRQMEEIWLTAAQSLFAVVLLVRWRVGALAALALFIPWATQLGLTSTAARYGYVVAYLMGALALLSLDRVRRREAWRLVPRTVEAFRHGATRGGQH